MASCGRSSCSWPVAPSPRCRLGRRRAHPDPPGRRGAVHAERAAIARRRRRRPGGQARCPRWRRAGSRRRPPGRPAGTGPGPGRRLRRAGPARWRPRSRRPRGADTGLDPLARLEADSAILAADLAAIERGGRRAGGGPDHAGRGGSGADGSPGPPRSPGGGRAVVAACRRGAAAELAALLAAAERARAEVAGIETHLVDARGSGVRPPNRASPPPGPSWPGAGPPGRAGRQRDGGGRRGDRPPEGTGRMPPSPARAPTAGPTLRRPRRGSEPGRRPAAVEGEGAVAPAARLAGGAAGDRARSRLLSRRP